jgi:hypothetical protein
MNGGAADADGCIRLEGLLAIQGQHDLQLAEFWQRHRGALQIDGTMTVKQK